MATKYENLPTGFFAENGIPKQVMFWDGEGMCSGILYKDVVICACCGGVYEVQDILENVPEGQTALRIFKDWIGFSEEIGEDEENA